MESAVRSGEGIRHVVAAIAGAVAVFCLVGWGVFYKVAGVAVVGLHGGPTALAGAMAGLFGGGLAAVVVFVIVLKAARR